MHLWTLANYILAQGCNWSCVLTTKSGARGYFSHVVADELSIVESEQSKSI